MHANSILFLSHTEASRRYLPAGLGEIANAYKLKKLFSQEGYSVQPIEDVYELFSGLDGLYKTLSEINFELAGLGHEIIDEIALPEAKEIKSKILSKGADRLFILSLGWSVAALFSLGIQKKIPCSAKLYVHHKDQRVETPLYQQAHLLLTEALLANEKGAEYGIPIWKMIHLPNYFHYEEVPLQKSRKVLLERIRRKKPDLSLSPHTPVVGCVSRLILGKNVEYTLDLVKRLVDQGIDLFFVLKGVPVKTNPYEEAIQKKIEALENEKWFFWDKEVSPFSEAIEMYNGFDLCLHLSGAEAGSNTIVEMLCLGLPTFIIQESTAPSLFTGAALFVKPKKRIENIELPFFLPDEEDAYEKVKNLIMDKKLQKEIGEKARQVARMRFSKERVVMRIPLILEAMGAYFEGGRGAERVKKEVEKLYQEDRKIYASP